MVECDAVEWWNAMLSIGGMRCCRMVECDAVEWWYEVLPSGEMRYTVSDQRPRWLHPRAVAHISSTASQSADELAPRQDVHVTDSNREFTRVEFLLSPVSPPLPIPWIDRFHAVV